MGNCRSCDSTHVATAKLILPDGQLQEFSCPVKVSYVLQKNPAFFICNADEMEFDDVVSAINDDEELQLGQLYFALPLSRLKHKLRPEEMAALAVKASSALSGAGDKCGCRRKPVYPGENEIKTPRRTLAVAGRGGGGRRKFSAMLSAIPE